MKCDDVVSFLQVSYMYQKHFLLDLKAKMMFQRANGRQNSDPGKSAWDSLSPSHVFTHLAGLSQASNSKA